MAAQAREALLELGFENDKVNKAVKHFGSCIDISEAVEWILNDCPGYVDYAPPAHQAPHPSSNTQVVPYVGPQQDSGQSAPYSQAQQNDNSGWVSAYQEQSSAQLTDNDVASSILALKDSRNATGSQVQQNRNRSDSLVTQPPGDNPWEVKPGDLDRPYTKIPLEPPTEDVPHSQYAATMDQNRMPTIDLTNADGNVGTSAPRASPIDPALRSNSNLTPSGDGDADLERAIALSLAESNKAAASSDMSRTGSLSRARQQEEDDYNRALSQSMLFADQQASTSSLKEQDPLDTRIRSDPDTPVVVSSPSSFLAYLPSMMHTFYANPLFRKVILELEMDYVQTPSFEKYGGDAPVLTRSLLQPSAPDCVVKLAALQRLFLFMSHSRRAKSGLTDIMDAYGIKIPNGARDRNPLSDMKGKLPS